MIICFVVWCVTKHIKNNKLPENTPTPYVIVTLLVDEINFTDYIPKVYGFIWKKNVNKLCWFKFSYLFFTQDHITFNF